MNSVTINTSDGTITVPVLYVCEKHKKQGRTENSCIQLGKIKCVELTLVNLTSRIIQLESEK